MWMVRRQQCQALLEQNDISANHYRGDISANKYEEATLVQMLVPGRQGQLQARLAYS